MQNGFINGYTKDLPVRQDILGMPQTPGNLGRFIGYTASGAPKGEASLYRVGDWVMTLDGHIFVASVYTGPVFGWNWTDLIVAGLQGILTTKGDLLIHDGAGNVSRLPVGTFGQVLTADTTATSGEIWGNPPGGDRIFLARTGAAYETCDRRNVNTITAALTSGTVYMTAIYLPKDFLVTNLATWSGSTAAVTPTHWWFTLCDSTRKTLRSTADQLTAAWVANTEQVKALSSTFRTTYEGLYYIGVMMVAATPITVQTWTTTAAAQALLAAPILAGNSSTGQTTAPADGTILAAITASNSQNYAYVS